MRAPLPPNETERLAALRDYRILDSSAEQVFDDLTRLAAHICGVPIAMISLVDESRQWFKAKVGVRRQHTPREDALCAHAILSPEPLIVTDASKDSRFLDSSLVTRSPHIRFYAGFPLMTQEGHALGTLCAVDRKPRTLTEAQKQAMGALARQVMCYLEMRRVSSKLADALEHVRTLRGLLPICAWCKRIRDDDGYWKQVEAYLRANTEADFTHGICPDCMEKETQKNRAVSSEFAASL